MGIGDRIKVAAGKISPSLSAFCDLVGVPYRTVQNYIAGAREPQSEILSQICTRSGIDANWLLTGEGEMLREEKSRITVVPAAEPPTGYVPSHARRIEALIALLNDLAPEARDAIINDAFARASAAQQLAQLRLAVEILTAKAAND